MRGATQIKVTSGSTPFCIDSTEATNTQYAQFVASGFTSSAIPGGCEQLTDPTPSDGWPAGAGYEQYPVTNVNWCQAYFFCQWAGKRLCGQIGGGALAPPNNGDASLSQWVNACSQGGALTYPYGSSFDANACGGQAANSRVAIVGTQPGCVGGVPGVYDMSGNVWEWTDTCSNSAPASNAFCDAMGGAFDSMPTELECVGERNWTRSSGAANIGIRCCLDL